MSIYGIGQNLSYQNLYGVGSVSDTNAGVQNKQSVTQAQDVLDNSVALPDKSEDTRKVFTDPKEISIGINKNDDYSYIGKDKEIGNLDIRKAISDMKKDSILQEYQYFVGSSRNFRSEDGIVLQKQ